MSMKNSNDIIWNRTRDNRNEYQEYFLGSKDGQCVGPTIISPSCADCLEIRKSQTTGSLRACSGLYRDCLLYLVSGVPKTTAFAIPLGRWEYLVVVSELLNVFLNQM
jgi:hypothetical protein